MFTNGSIFLGEKGCFYLKGKKKLDISETLTEFLNTNKELKKIDKIKNNTEFLIENQKKINLKNKLIPLIRGVVEAKHPTFFIPIDNKIINFGLSSNFNQYINKKTNLTKLINPLNNKLTYVSVGVDFDMKNIYNIRALNFNNVKDIQRIDFLHKVVCDMLLKETIAYSNNVFYHNCEKNSNLSTEQLLDIFGENPPIDITDFYKDGDTKMLLKKTEKKIVDIKKLIKINKKYDHLSNNINNNYDDDDGSNLD